MPLKLFNPLLYAKIMLCEYFVFVLSGYVHVA